MSAPEVNESLISLISTIKYIFERDNIGHAPSVFSYEHHQIHEANLFNFGTHLPALNGSVSYLLYNVGTNGSAKRAHFVHGLSSNGVARVYLYQDPTIVAPGTLLGNPPLMNYKQGGGTAVALEVYINPNISAPGTLRPSHNLEIGGSGVGGQSSSGETVRSNEIIFGSDKYWLVVVDTDAAQIVNYNATWYEKEG